MDRPVFSKTPRFSAAKEVDLDASASFTPKYCSAVFPLYIVLNKEMVKSGWPFLFDKVMEPHQELGVMRVGLDRNMRIILRGGGHESNVSCATGRENHAGENN